MNDILFYFFVAVFMLIVLILIYKGKHTLKFAILGIQLSIIGAILLLRNVGFTNTESIIGMALLIAGSFSTILYLILKPRQ